MINHIKQRDSQRQEIDVRKDNRRVIILFGQRGMSNESHETHKQNIIK